MVSHLHSFERYVPQLCQSERPFLQSLDPQYFQRRFAWSFGNAHFSPLRKNFFGLCYFRVEQINEISCERCIHSDSKFNLSCIISGFHKRRCNYRPFIIGNLDNLLDGSISGFEMKITHDLTTNSYIAYRSIDEFQFVIWRPM